MLNRLLIIFFYAFMCSCTTNYEYKYLEQKEYLGKPINNKNWIFEGNKLPRLNLYDEDEFIRDINEALDIVGLPHIHSKVPEKSEITGFRGDRAIFEWESYPQGTLLVFRTSRSYGDCIWKIMVKQ